MNAPLDAEYGVLVPVDLPKADILALGEDVVITAVMVRK